MEARRFGPLRYSWVVYDRAMPYALQLLALTLVPVVAAGAGNERIFSERIAPVLAKNCAACHGGDDPAGDLSVDGLASLLRGGKHGPAIRPGVASESLLIAYLSGERTPKMPLGGDLPATEIEQIASALDAMEPLEADAEADESDARWLLARPVRTEPAEVPQNNWVRNPIDSFVLAKLAAEGLSPADRADRRVLIRRVHFDLTGLPPSPEEVSQFLEDAAPGAYTRLIERVLAKPEYGERWGRHWLDLVRYAESDGFAVDRERPTAWRYRDYVIRAFNQDKPYDLFVKEQIAGDELDGEPPDSRSDRTVALGFLRMGPWEQDAISMKKLRQDFLNELTAVSGSAFLGLTVGCAQCHDHKYDPIPQRDFYRLLAFFAATRVDDLQVPYSEAEGGLTIKREMRKCEDRLDEAKTILAQIQERLVARFVELENVVRDDDERLTTFKRELNVQNEFFRKRDGAIFREPVWFDWLRAKDERDRLAELYERHRPVAAAVSDLVPPHVPEVATTYVMAGGEFDSPTEKVEPGFPASVERTGEAAEIGYKGGSSGRRLALSEWIASPANPLTARVMVNRIWQHHFGYGIVRTPSDFGKNGERPTHPALLDWLATEFVESGWSVKRMHRLMLSSATYTQATEHRDRDSHAERDPENRLLWRMNWARLDAESIRDTLLALGGRLDTRRGGPPALLDVPPDIAEGFEFFKWFPSPPEEQRRRTVYTFQRRSVVQPFMETFDVANMSASCSRRNSTTVAPQALTLLNGALVNGEAPHFARRVIREAGRDRADQVDRAFLLTLGRTPSPTERDRALQAFAGAQPEEALARIGVVLFNLNEFLYLQ